MLSYAIPQRYKDHYLDSRMCPEITNVSINVARIMSLFGITEIANPIEAHTAYNNDERVLDLIAFGLGNEYTTDNIDTRCKWTKTNIVKSKPL